MGPTGQGRGGESVRRGCTIRHNSLRRRIPPLATRLVNLLVRAEAQGWRWTGARQDTGASQGVWRARSAA
eukprot:scaffold625_cov324-Pavlova_lutheri.AAC.25